MRPPITRMTALLTAAAVAVGGTGAAQALAHGDGSHGRPGPPSTTRQAALAKELGVSVAQLRAAEQAIRPSDPRKGGPGDLATKLARALGVDTAKIEAILDANRPAPPADGARPAKPDRTALVTALAKGLNVDAAKVEAALAKVGPPKGKRERGDHAAALAKQLGLNTDIVQSALDKLRPAKPAAAAGA